MRRSLAGRALNYAPTGVTLDDPSWWLGDHAGFRTYERSARIGGPERWADASDALMRWQVKTRSGFDVVDGEGRPATPVAVGDRRWLVARVGPLRVREPVEVVAVADGEDRIGFAYGTLTGHPVSGEDAFLLHRDDDGSVLLTVRSLSRPGAGVWRAAHPAVRIAQQYYRRRYLRALR
jgi:uncharacterized protein (UPF0548 family)